MQFFGRRQKNFAQKCMLIKEYLLDTKDTSYGDIKMHVCLQVSCYCSNITLHIMPVQCSGVVASSPACMIFLLSSPDDPV